MRYLILFFLFLISCSPKEVKASNSNNFFYDKAFVFLEKEDRDSAFYYFYKSKNYFQNKNDSLGVGKSLMNSGIIQLQSGDYYGSEDSFISALKYFNEERDKDYLISVYNSIAISRLNQKDYKFSIDWYKKALQVSSNQLDVNSIKNNIAVVFIKLKKYNTAIDIFENLLKINKKNTLINSKIIDNLAFAKYLQNKNYNAETELYNALKIREQEKDLWGQNASHAHLSEYFSNKNKEKALFHAHKMYEITTKINSDDDRLEALQKLILLESPENAKKYFLVYQKLNDSLQTVRTNAKNQFALYRYDSEKNRANFLKSEADNVLKQNRILRQNIALGLMAVIFFGGFFWYKKRKKRLEQEKELEVKNTELKFSKKVHDVVANNLYQTMVEVENLPEINKEKLLDKLEKMYEESRDIAHENISTIAQKDFSQKLSEMISSYSSENHKVFIVGNQEKIWKNIPPKVRDEVYFVLRELMVNMKKHSQAELISVKFEKNEKKLQIFYTDNGLGINGLEKNKQSGIKNTENRIFNIGGGINFEKNPKGGLLVNISIPINYV